MAARRVSRRRILSSLLVAPVAATVGCGADPGRNNEGPPVVVIGAGLAGLAAALALLDAGRETVVIEARERVGGRVHTAHRGDGAPVEAGGEFIDGNHRRVRALVKRFKLKLDEVAYDDSLDALVLFEGELYSEDEFVTATVRSSLDHFEAEIEGLAKGLDPDHPLRHASARTMEGRTVASFLDELGLDARARFLIEGEIRAEFTVEAERLSLLALAQGTALYRDVDDDDIERWRIAGGNAQLPKTMALALGQRLRLETVCTRLTVLDETVEVETTKGSITAKAAIVALPSAVLPSVEFVGAPPSLREVLASLPQTGDVLKVIAEFDRASWKENGLSGESSSDLCATYAPASRALTIYASGNPAQAFRPRNGSHVEPSLAHLFRVFDATPKALPLLFDWASEPFSRGGYTAFAPGGMSAWEGLRALHGHVVLAGEYTDTFWGYMEGAIRSGERAAKQILKAGF